MTPCDLLFIGDAPSVSDDTLGKPFTGPAGSLLDDLISEASVDPLTYAITNTLGCFPDDGHGNARQPKKSELVRCFDRVIEFIRICRPASIILLGEATDRTMQWADDLVIGTYSPIRVRLSHPSYLSRTGGKDSVGWSYAVVELRRHVEFIKRCKGW